MPDGERVILRLKPAPISVLLRRGGVWVLLVAAMAAGWWGHRAYSTNATVDRWWPTVAAVLVALALLHLLWEIAVWFGAVYALTDRRIAAGEGVFRRIHVDIPLEKGQQAVVVQGFWDRVFGVGSIGIESAGTQGPAVVWRLVTRPAATLATIRAAMESVSPSRPRVRPLILGLTGTIGAGKSTAGRILAELGPGVVIDSDVQARAALDRPDVKGTLVEWWGRGILNADGRVDRKKVGDIVFAKPDERARLERLVHPIIRASRAELVAEATAAGKPVVIVDAPLLLEAGVDKECDAVVLIDAPRDVRLSRVAARGWDQAELTRREAAQWPLDRKLAKADERILNDGTEARLRESLAAALDRLRRRPGRREA